MPSTKSYQCTCQLTESQARAVWRKRQNQNQREPIYDHETPDMYHQPLPPAAGQTDRDRMCISEARHQQARAVHSGWEYDGSPPHRERGRDWFRLRDGSGWVDEYGQCWLTAEPRDSVCLAGAIAEGWDSDDGLLNYWEEKCPDEAMRSWVYAVIEEGHERGRALSTPEELQREMSGHGDGLREIRFAIDELLAGGFVRVVSKDGSKFFEPVKCPPCPRHDALHAESDIVVKAQLRMNGQCTECHGYIDRQRWAHVHPEYFCSCKDGKPEDFGERLKRQSEAIRARKAAEAANNAAYDKWLRELPALLAQCRAPVTNGGKS